MNPHGRPRDERKRKIAFGLLRGKMSRKEICELLDLSKRNLERWIAEARKTGEMETPENVQPGAHPGKEMIMHFASKHDLSIAQTCKLADRSSKTIIKWRKQLDEGEIEPEEVVGQVRYANATDEERQRAMDLVESGCTHEEAGRITGFAKSTVNTWMMEERRRMEIMKIRALEARVASLLSENKEMILDIAMLRAIIGRGVRESYVPVEDVARAECKAAMMKRELAFNDVYMGMLESKIHDMDDPDLEDAMPVVED